MIQNTEDEKNNSNSSTAVETCKRHFDKNCDKAEMSCQVTSNDGDEQFWAEDELSSCESQLQFKKRKRQHSLVQRNMNYNKSSRKKTLSSSSDFSNSKNASERPKRLRKKKKFSERDNKATTSRLSTSDSRNNSMKKHRGSKFRFFSNKKK